MMLHLKHSRLSPEVRGAVIRAAFDGLSYREIIGRLGVSMGSVTNVLRPFGGVYRRELWADPSPHRMGLEDRIQIWRMLRAEEPVTFAEIGAVLERPRHKSTICREVNANGGRDAYRPVAGQKRADNARRRDKPTKLATHPELRAVVANKLEALWSPEQIAAHLRAEFGDDDTMTVSHETIYKSLFVQGRGELKRELTACLRTGRAQRRPQARGPSKAGQIADMVMISERPAEVEDRAVPGHWEGDLIIGKDGKSAVGTLVERSSRLVMLLYLDGDRTAETVRTAMTAKITELPPDLARSITWDQGTEMSQHAQFTVETGVPIYFCEPHSPWQRGSNENTNGLLRQYMPKGTDLSQHTQADLDAFAQSLNTRPRKTLGWATPADYFAGVVAATP